ncbi:signal recognition particle protein [Parafannyhessea umbonata]|uniref:Signal recognition particle protein n=1 Tax=Parafannyhessea umbonata TaxID=604330 RepID=A0A1G6JQV0_9ACTN|nr:signal recognition particle protein [Parafannyhessea umbonata]SDC21073.1 signal recognition particle subunit FFH/SRP54 (srp54) [Parafannyhessea umbonata]
MFNSLSDRLQDTFGKLRGKGRLTEDDINTAMREIRMALLEADVNYRVVKKFVAECKEKCMTAEVLESLSPAQNVVRIVLDQLTELLGTTESKLVLAQNRTPNVIMLVGLQGSGKTTAAAKLAYLLKRQGHSPVLAACDVHRPAAADQLETLGNEIGVKVYRGDGKDAVKVARESIQSAVDGLNDIVIVDTAGRLQIDEQMMQEAVDIKNAVKPDQVLMVVDAMTGQDIVNVVSEFANRVDFDGVIMSKLDGDARGGGALSVREVTGKPIKFVSMGEKPDSLEVFHPDRMAKRILGMGDVVSIIEEAQRVTDQKDIDDAERMLREGFTMDDMLTQMQQIRKMGGLKKILASLPGGERALQQAGGAVSDEQITRIEAMIHSMTKQERAKPKTINGQRRKRIAKGSGRSVQEVNQLLKQWSEMDKMMGKMRQLTNGGGNSRKARRQMTNMMRNMGMGGKMPF